MNAYLSLDWEPPLPSVSAEDFLTHPQTPSEGAIHIANCESLFRRAPGGFGKIKKLVLEAKKSEARQTSLTCQCHFNAFAYSFLVGAKNFDLLLPESTDNPFRKELPSFMETIDHLATFEQKGEEFPNSLKLEEHLEARALLTRPSARDERRVLAELLISGPSTAKQLSDELDLWSDLTDRVLDSLGSIRLVCQNKNNDFMLCKDRLPSTYFLLRATLGLEPLLILERTSIRS